jgi:hypothetical protein
MLRQVGFFIALIILGSAVVVVITLLLGQSADSIDEIEQNYRRGTILLIILFIVVLAGLSVYLYNLFYLRGL